MFDLLPKDICTDIFNRLPIKTLVICACTCKPLLNFLTSPDFMNTHLKKSKENPFIHLRYYKYIDNKEGGHTNEYFALQPDNETFNGEFDVMEMPITDRANRYLTVVGCCNGVICLSDDARTYTRIMYLWNPCLKKGIRVPYPKIWYGSHGDYASCVGFGFDEVANDYKIVRLVYLEDEDPKCDDECPLVEIYTVNSKSWRMLEVAGPKCFIRGEYYDGYEDPYSTCYLNGFMHWPGYNGFGSVWSVIVTFDVHNEGFGEMKLPGSLEGLSERGFDLKVTVCRDKLGLIRMPRQGTSGKSSGSIWVMGEYGNVDSWTVLFNFDEPTKYPAPEALYFRRNMDILMLSGELRLNNTMYTGVFSVGNGKAEAQVLGIMEGPLKGFHLGSYEESLALFSEAKAIHLGGVDEDEDEDEEESEPEEAESD